MGITGGGQRIALTGPDGAFSAYHAPAIEARRGGLVILHAIWGVTPHIRALSDQMAERGYQVIAPSLLGPGNEDWPDRDIDPPLLAARLAMGEASGWGASCLGRVQAAVDALAAPVFLMGFCFGGSTAWLAASRCAGLTAVASFYGGNIHPSRHETPACPTILHFGKTDETIPPGDVADIEAAHPDLPIWLYSAGHAFVAPSGYHAESAELAMLRTLQLFQRSGGTRGEV